MKFIKKMFYKSYKFHWKFVLKRRIRLTWMGSFIVTCSLGALILSGNSKLTMGYQIFDFLLVLIFISAFYAYTFRGKYKVKRVLPKFATVDNPLNYKVIVEGKNRKKESGLEIIDLLKNPTPEFDEFLLAREPGERKRNPVDRYFAFYRWQWLIRQKSHGKGFVIKDVTQLIPGSSTEVVLTVTPAKRGKLIFSNIIVARKDPFGLFRGLKKITIEDTVVVLPKRYNLGDVFLPGGRKYQKGGVTLASSVGESEEFHSLRDYTHGEPVRFIDWKSWAKTDKPVIRKYEEEYFSRHALLLDTFGTEDLSDTFEICISIAASLIVSIKDMDSLLDLMFVENEVYCFTIGRSIARKLNGLELLAEANLCKDKEFEILVKSVKEKIHAINSLICVFLRWDKDRKELLDFAQANGVSIMAFVVSNTVEKPTGKHMVENNINNQIEMDTSVVTVINQRDSEKELNGFFNKHGSNI